MSAEDGREQIGLAIVEDHVTLRQGLEMLLRNRGYVIAGSAATARAGYELVGRANPDVVIIDLQLPDESGAELTRRLLADRPELGVLLYTGIEDEERLEDALACGARGFASKVGSQADLMRAIDAVAAGGTYVDPHLNSILLRRSTTERIKVISPRESEVLDLLSRGMNGEQAAAALFLSPETIRTHVRNAMEKLGAHTRVHAVVMALEQGVIGGGEPKGSEGASPRSDGASPESGEAAPDDI
jgi:DNA-binding NarL/FixJ family response regulator